MDNLDSYRDGFKLFLSRTDEKQIINALLLNVIKRLRRNYFLDIGAGTGALTSIISRHFKKTLAVEPNRYFIKELEAKGIKTIGDRWEDANLQNKKFDFILAAYVIGYFSDSRIKAMIKKMFEHLTHGGVLALLVVDDRRGSWRKLYTKFYELMNKEHKATLARVKVLFRGHKVEHRIFTTYVVPRNEEEILMMLQFDWSRWKREFLKHQQAIRSLTKKFLNQGGGKLSIVHHLFVIAKNKY